MKKLLLTLIIATMLSACGNNGSDGDDGNAKNSNDSNPALSTNPYANNPVVMGITMGVTTLADLNGTKWNTLDNITYYIKNYLREHNIHGYDDIAYAVANTANDDTKANCKADGIINIGIGALTGHTFSPEMLQQIIKLDGATDSDKWFTTPLTSKHTINKVTYMILDSVISIGTYGTDICHY